MKMKKLTFYLIAVGVFVSGTGASSVRDGDRAKLQLILGSAGTNDRSNIPEARYKRQAFIITDDPGPLGIEGVLDGQLVVEEPDPVNIAGPVSGKLENGRSSVDLRKITDGSFPIAVEGKFRGTLDVKDNDLQPDTSMVKAKVDLTVELTTVTDLKQISIIGQLEGSLQIDTSQEAYRTIVDDPEPVGILGEIVGSLIFPAGWKQIGVPDTGK